MLGIRPGSTDQGITHLIEDEDVYDDLASQKLTKTARALGNISPKFGYYLSMQRELPAKFAQRGRFLKTELIQTYV